MDNVAEKQSFDEETRLVFSDLYKRRVSIEEAREIKDNFLGLVEVLRDLDQREV